MNQRQRLLCVLKGEQPDRVPWYGDLLYWADARKYRKEVPDNFWKTKEMIDWHRELGVGAYLFGYVPFEPHYNDVDFNEWIEGDLKGLKIVTPRGILRSCWRFMPISYSWGPIEPLVKSVDDLPAFNYFWEHISFTPNFEEGKWWREQLTDIGVVVAYFPRSPLSDFIVSYSNIEVFVDLFLTVPDKLEETLHLMEERKKPACEFALDCHSDLVFFPENISSEVWGKRFFELYARHYYEKWTLCVRQASKYSFVHMDGTLRGLLREVASTGFTALEALTPTPVGDVSVSEFETIVQNDSVIFWGGMPGGMFTSLFTEKDFENHIIEVLEVMRKKPRYVLGVADQIPPDVVPERVKCVSKFVELYGSYE